MSSKEPKINKPISYVKTELVTTASKELEVEVEKDLEKPDPDQELAEAILQDNKKPSKASI